MPFTFSERTHAAFVRFLPLYTRFCNGGTDVSPVDLRRSGKALLSAVEAELKQRAQARTLTPYARQRLETLREQTDNALATLNTPQVPACKRRGECATISAFSVKPKRDVETP